MGALRIYPGRVILLGTELSLDWQFRFELMRPGLVIPP
ncbi:hypothetical protein F383_27093 [Gossypium arboreum]|uniref:Uncharacterized protein n=1 Tax=Gossypium arboreum TaxID=29729 RepID=A0A0B0P387_GOSAR|nr:hypothetical protein F383_05382 [Gossypium arboreum]KHG21761.1 hypothetical protein F383_27093 [Gossypium arboreum]